jgi:hypothetical protein
MRQWAWIETPSLIGALIFAELFYKFHSFTLECVAFLLTWLAVSFVLTQMNAAIQNRAREQRSDL